VSCGVLPPPGHGGDHTAFFFFPCCSWFRVRLFFLPGFLPFQMSGGGASGRNISPIALMGILAFGSPASRRKLWRTEVP
jgi:hypothetical protein